MARRQSMGRRWSTAARWPLGVMLTSWRYLWQTTPTHRWELSGSWPGDAHPTAKRSYAEQLQRLGDGVGPLIHRIYRTRIVGSALTAEELMKRMAEDLDASHHRSSPPSKRLEAKRALLAKGTSMSFVCRALGVGPVRVVAAKTTSFTLATLDGHWRPVRSSSASTPTTALWYSRSSPGLAAETV